MDGMMEDAALGEVLAFVDEFYVNDNGELLAHSEPLTRQDTSADEDHDADAILHDSMDSESLGSSSPQSSSCSSSETAVVHAPSKAKKRRAVVRQADSAAARYRTRNPRHELAYLRATVLELEKKLELLTLRGNTQHVQQGNRQARIKSAVYGLTTADVSVSNWEEIASWQLAQRHSAERENIMLRSALEDQLKLAKSLEGVLSKRTYRKLLSSMGSVPVRLVAKLERRKMEVRSMKRPLATSQLHAELMGMYEQIPSIFADPRFQSADNPHRVVNLRDDAVSGKWVETLEARVLPFDFRVIGNAQWENSVSLTERNGLAFAKLEETDDMVVKGFKGTVDFPNASAECRIRVILQRFVEPRQISVISFLRIDPISASGTPIDGVTLQNRTWQVIRPIGRQHTLFDGQQASTSHIYQACKPVPCEGSSDRELKVTTLAKFVHGSVHYELDARYQKLEDRLMDGMLS